MEANQNKAEGFLKQGSILAAASIFVRLIGMFYRIRSQILLEKPVMESIPRRLRYTIFY